MTVTQEHTVLDDLNLIERVKNHTPWDTGDLVSFLVPYIRGLISRFPNIRIETHTPKPGTKRENQATASVRNPYGSRHLVISILSPKRAKSRTDLLDRLSFAGDLESHESVMPVYTMEDLAHYLLSMRSVSKNTPAAWQCESGRCSCAKVTIDNPPIIRGCTKTRTRPAKTLEQLERSLRYARRRIATAQAKLDKSTKEEARLLKRIAKRKALEEKA